MMMIKPVFTQDSPRIHAVFVSLRRFFSRLVPNKPVAFGLKASEQFLLVLVKLKPAVQNQDLADRFCIHITKVLKVFHLWKDLMFNVVTDLISLLDHGLIRKIYLNVSRVNTAHYLHHRLFRSAH